MKINPIINEAICWIGETIGTTARAGFMAAAIAVGLKAGCEANKVLWAPDGNRCRPPWKITIEKVAIEFKWGKPMNECETPAVDVMLLRCCSRCGEPMDTGGSTCLGCQKAEADAREQAYEEYSERVYDRERGDWRMNPQR